jgi:hypothetical protein
MSKPSQGISRSNCGEEQPVDKDRAQTTHHTRSDDTTPSKQGRERQPCPLRPLARQMIGALLGPVSRLSIPDAREETRRRARQ